MSDLCDYSVDIAACNQAETMEFWSATAVEADEGGTDDRDWVVA